MRISGADQSIVKPKAATHPEERAQTINVEYMDEKAAVSWPSKQPAATLQKFNSFGEQPFVTAEFATERTNRYTQNPEEELHQK